MDDKLKIREDAQQMIKEAKQMRAELRPPHLVTSGNLKRCSVCGYPLGPNIKPSSEEAFAQHVLDAHKPGRLVKT